MQKIGELRTMSKNLIFSQMSKTQHTPGKWRIAFMEPNDPESDFWVKSDSNDVVPYGTDILCEYYGEHNGYPREQRLADAELVASAPESHKANLLSLEVFSEIEMLIQNEKSLTPKVIAGISNAIEKNTEAIKKATE